jgi:hypothetical protein
MLKLEDAEKREKIYGQMLMFRRNALPPPYSSGLKCVDSGTWLVM